MIIMVITVISIMLYLTNKDEHTALYKINNNVYIKTAKIINDIWSSHMHVCMHTHTHTHTRM